MRALFGISAFLFAIAPALAGEEHRYTVTATFEDPTFEQPAPIVDKTVYLIEYGDDPFWSWFSDDAFTNTVHKGGKTDKTGKGVVKYNENSNHWRDTTVCLKNDGPYYCTFFSMSAGTKDGCYEKIGNEMKACSASTKNWKYNCKWELLQQVATDKVAEYKVVCTKR
jgi:hypothetical protein